MDSLPHLHEPAPGIIIALGYNGRGVAMASTMGGLIAKRLTGANETDYPITPLSPILWHSARRPLMAAAVSYYWLKDGLGFNS